jgi:hypothetical protein
MSDKPVPSLNESIPALRALVEERGLVPARLGEIIGFLKDRMEIEQLERALDILRCVLSREYSAKRYSEGNP